MQKPLELEWSRLVYFCTWLLHVCFPSCYMFFIDNLLVSILSVNCYIITPPPPRNLSSLLGPVERTCQGVYVMYIYCTSDFCLPIGKTCTKCTTTCDICLSLGKTCCTRCTATCDTCLSLGRTCTRCTQLPVISV